MGIPSFFSICFCRLTSFILELFNYYYLNHKIKHENKHEINELFRDCTSKMAKSRKWAPLSSLLFRFWSRIQTKCGKSPRRGN